MRNITVICLCAALSLQTGCAWTPRFGPMMLGRSSEKKSEKAVHDKPTAKAAETYLAARQLESDGKYEEARERYEEMIRRSPKNPEYLHRIGVVCTHLQRFAEATSYYEQALKLDPKNGRLLADMGYSAYLKGDLIAAEKYLREAHARKPSDQRTTNNLALVLGIKGKTDESLKLLKESDDDDAALASMAYIRFKRGETDMARQLYAEALELNPDLKEAKTALAKLGKPKTEETIAANVRETKPEKPARLVKNTAKFDEDQPIQQAAASVEESPKQLKTAVYESESVDDDLHAEFSGSSDKTKDDAFGESPVDPFEEEPIEVSRPAAKAEMEGAPEVIPPESSETRPAVGRASRKKSPLLDASFELVDETEFQSRDTKTKKPATARDLIDDSTESKPKPTPSAAREKPKRSVSTFDEADLE